MKTLALSNVAWVATIRTFQDGDVFRESNIDLNAGDIADRLGYLKAKEALSVKVGDTPVAWTGAHTFGGTATVFSLGAVISAGGLDVTGASIVRTSLNSYGPFTFQTQEGAGLIERYATGSDATGTEFAITDRLAVPGMAANRVWTIAHAGVPAGRRFRVTRNRTADAFTLELRRVDATSLATISASAQGWVELTFTTKWIVTAWGGTVTAINTDVS